MQGKLTPASQTSKTMLFAEGSRHEMVKKCHVCKALTCAGSELYFTGYTSVMPAEVWKNLDRQNTGA